MGKPSAGEASGRLRPISISLNVPMPTRKMVGMPTSEPRRTELYAQSPLPKELL
jgi:hypothetical protein